MPYNWGMELPVEQCYPAVVARDRRFDGRFFTGVTSTGVYCRPICPATTPRIENVRFYPSAAAAQAAGFRPCRRCLPEHSAGTPAWSEVPEPVSRALHLIGEGALDEGGVAALAARVGIGDRQLRRLFDAHFGAGPLAVAKARRLHFAKRLLDETNLPVTQIAFAAGYGSLRAFNHDFRSTFRRPPTGVRRVRRAHTTANPVGTAKPAANPAGAANPGGAPLTLRLAYRPPLHWKALEAFLAGRATRGVEVVEPGCYRRTIESDGASGVLELRHVLDQPYLSLSVSLPSTSGLIAIVERARRIADLGADPLAIATTLERDSILRPLVRRNPGLRVPGAWDGFELTVRAILGQQVSVAAATTMAGRLVETFGKPLESDHGPGLTHVFPAAQTLADADVASIGLPSVKAEAIRSVARAVAGGELRFQAPAGLNDLVERLVALPGIGPWTAHYVAMRACGEPDAFPAGDLALRKAAGDGGELMRESDLRRRAEAWRPWRSYAAMHLWRSFSEGSGG